MSGTLTYWTEPDSYAGFSPEGHILILSRNRDSDALDRTNWAAARERLARAAGLDSIPQDDRECAVYDWRAGHWAVGWIEYLMVNPAVASPAVIQEAQAIADDLHAYPALDEEAWSELEYEEACQFWVDLGVRGRLDMIAWARERGDEVSPFAARREEIPSDFIEEHLRAA